MWATWTAKRTKAGELYRVQVAVMVSPSETQISQFDCMEPGYGGLRQTWSIVPWSWNSEIEFYAGREISTL